MLAFVLCTVHDEGELKFSHGTQAAVATPPSVQGHPIEQAAISQLLARLPRPPQGLQVRSYLFILYKAAYVQRSYM